MMNRRRQKGNGSISFDKNKNSFIACVRDIFGKRIQKRFKEKADAEKWILEMRLKVINNDIYEKDITFGEWVIKYLALKKTMLKDSTFRTLLSQVKNFQPLFAIKLKKLRPLTLQTFIIENRLYEKKIAMQTINNIFNLAFKYEIIPENPLKKIILPKIIKDDKMNILTNEQIEKILAIAKDYNYMYDVILLLYTTGMRIGELLALNWQDFNYSQKTLTINKSLTQIRRTVSTPKNQKSIRAILLNEKTATHLNDLYKSKKPNSTDYIIGCKNNAICYKIAREKFKKICNLAGYNNINIHDFRHTHATKLLIAGIPITEISKRLGHTLTSTTLNTYLHVAEDSQKALKNKINNIF